MEGDYCGDALDVLGFGLCSSRRDCTSLGFEWRGKVCEVRERGKVVCEDHHMHGLAETTTSPIDFIFHLQSGPSDTLQQFKVSDAAFIKCW